MQAAAPLSIVDHVDRDGFAIIENLIPGPSIQQALGAIARSQVHPAVRQRRGATVGIRNLLEVVPEVREIVECEPLQQLLRNVLRGSPFLTRAILFDKNAEANWAVPWHQDTTIAVRQKIDAPGFGPWSVKAGVVHVQPPPSVLQHIITARVHLDDCSADGGALIVLPGSHRSGILYQSQIERYRTEAPHLVCPVTTGGVMLMRPLLLHSSAAAASPRHRRVIHLEFAACALPGGLQWHRP